MYTPYVLGASCLQEALFYVPPYPHYLKFNIKNHVCKVNINKTAKAYIEYVTVLEIKRLLAYSSKNVQEVAFHFGFDEPTNMVKFFKKHTKMTPTQFRSASK